MHVRNLRIAAGFGLSFGLLLSVSASAQQTETKAPKVDAPTLRARLEAAERAYTDARYADAVENYLAADRLQPTPAIQLALGKTYEELNDPSRALAAYREYFARSPRAPDRAQIQLRVAALAAQLAEKGVQQISVSSVPAGATVVIDTKSLGTTPIYIDLSPGPHHLEFHRPGYESAALDFELSAQQPLNVMTTLVATRAGSVASTPAPPAATPPLAPAPAPTLASAPAPTANTAGPTPTPAPAALEAPPATATPAQPEVSPEAAPSALAVTVPPPSKHDQVTTYMRSFGFGALGGSVLTLGTAVAFELMRSQSESRARQQRQQIAFKDTLDTMHSQQTIARVFAVTAGVLAATGGVLLVLASQRERTEASPEGAAVACAPTGCSAVYQGHF